MEARKSELSSDIKTEIYPGPFGPLVGLIYLLDWTTGQWD